MGRNPFCETLWSIRCIGCGSKLLARMVYADKARSQSECLHLHLRMKRDCATDYAEDGQSALWKGTRLIVPTAHVMRTEQGRYLVTAVSALGQEMVLGGFDKPSQAGDLLAEIKNLPRLTYERTQWRGHDSKHDESRGDLFQRPRSTST